MHGSKEIRQPDSIMYLVSEIGKVKEHKATKHKNHEKVKKTWCLWQLLCHHLQPQDVAKPPPQDGHLDMHAAIKYNKN